jgi:hypothetical protein
LWYLFKGYSNLYIPENIYYFLIYIRIPSYFLSSFFKKIKPKLDHFQRVVSKERKFLLVIIFFSLKDFLKSLAKILSVTETLASTIPHSSADSRGVFGCGIAGRSHVP